jgi:hypothetical protein
MSHPSWCNDPTCDRTYAAHVRDVAVSPAALPSRSVTRNPDTHDEPTTRTRAREKQFATDGAAYKRLRDAGLRPQFKGAAQRERELGG